jgi:protein-L-isoaspartate O-methyltransferase
MIHRIQALAWLIVIAIPLTAQRGGIESLAPFTPTPEAVVDRMLQLGELRPGERMFDLGSGDGRIVIAAARKYKADATGVEFEESLVKQSMKRIASLGLTSTAHIIYGDLMKQDYSSADLLTIYLLPIAGRKLGPILEKQLKGGARIVSHNAEFPNWTPLKIEEIPDDGEGHSHRLYLYKLSK